jgi:hypothetical protein
MPRATKGSQRELSLTSSFVAGGFSYHVDPAEIIDPAHGGKPLLFLRFEDPDNRRTNLTSDEQYYSDTQVNISPRFQSTAGTGNSSLYPNYSTETPYLYTNSVTGSRLTSDESRQIRSVEFGQNAGTYTQSLGISDPKVDNVSPTTIVENGTGDDHIFVNVQNSDFKDNLLLPFKGFTAAAWIKTRKNDLTANFEGSGDESTTLHFRPIFRSRRTSGLPSNEEALISFGYMVSLFNSGTNSHYHESLHKHLYFRYKDTYGTTPSLWTSYIEAPIDDEWHHVAVAVDQDNSSYLTPDTSVRFYCDGRYLKSFKFDVQPAQSKYIIETDIDYSIGGVEDVDYSEQAVVQIIFTGFPPAPISKSAVVGSFFLGNMDDVAIWNRGLSGDEIAAIYSAHRGAYDPQSGYLNNPPRSVIRDRDNTAGQYPTSNFSPGSNMTSTAFKEGD